MYNLQLAKENVELLPIARLLISLEFYCIYLNLKKFEINTEFN